jgi:hypothetical protein
MTFRWIPIRPSPAATATVLWDTIQARSRAISIGKPIGGFAAGTPIRPSASTIRRATSFR